MKRLWIGLAAVACSGIASAEKTDLELVSQQGVAHFLTLSKPWITKRDYVEKVVRGFCYNKDICRVHLWEKGKARPKGYPVSDRELATQVASYVQNTNTGLSQLRLSCKMFPDVPKDQCLN